MRRETTSKVRNGLVMFLLGVAFLPPEAVRPQSPQQPGVLERDRVVATLKQTLIPLLSVDPGAPGTDLMAIGAAIGDARVVALGEASHGSRELYQMKHRLFSYLVKEKGFSVVALEANWPESEAIDRYIRTGQGDPRSALAAMYQWPWQSEEHLALVEWMREFNRSSGRDRVLSFTSFDMQVERVALERVLDAVRGTAEEDAIRSAYAGVTPSSTADSAGLRLATDSAERVVDILERANAPSRTVQMARIVTQALQNRRGTLIGYRDQSMAANMLWLLRDRYPGEKIVIWAHNSHVGVGYPTHDGPPRSHSVSMGTWLRVALGSEMYVLGFAINSGTVRAIIFDNGRRIGVQEESLPPTPPSSGSRVLNATGVPNFFIDLRTSDASLRSWFAEPHAFQELGAGWDRSVGLGMRVFPLRPRFDGLIYLDKTSAARGLR